MLRERKRYVKRKKGNAKEERICEGRESISKERICQGRKEDVNELK